MANNPSLRVGGLKPRRNKFDLSYRKNFTCDMGQLIPIMCDEVVPGDYFKIGCELVIRFQPLAAPMMHEVTAHVHYFYMPKRLEYGTTAQETNVWEEFISQGELDTDDLPIKLPTFDLALTASHARDLGTLWDYFGFPVTREAIQDPNNIMVPLDTPWRVYNRIFNEYYRDQDLQSEVGDGVVKDEDGNLIPLNPFVLNRNWMKDYFTAARPWRQKGTAPALPVDINIGFNDLGGDSGYPAYLRGFDSQDVPYGYLGVSGTIGVGQLITGQNNNSIQNTGNENIPGLATLGVDVNDIGRGMTSPLNENGLYAKSTTFDVADLRLAFQTQKWLERNARAGTRYTEFLRSHFGVAPSDSRLDRPEYIGGIKVPVMVNEVLSHSATEGADIGQMGGHGLAADGQYAGDYNVQEYGTIMGILSVMPKPTYQQGINRQWLRRLPTDFYFPEFARLSEQAIYIGELYTDWGRSNPWLPFGFTGQYDEMRVKHDMVCSEMRKINDPSMPNQRNDLLSYWNMARWFNSKPLLNTHFITCDPDTRKDIFIVSDKPGLIVNVRNNIMATRPLPEIADPGFVDHY